MKIYLHIGAGKCASSSIQHLFSYENTHGSFAYGCLRPNGSVDVGDSVKRSAMKAAANYANSVNFAEGDIDEAFVRQFDQSLEQLSTRYERLLMSNEAWSGNSAAFSKLSSVFEKHDVEVIFIVRAPVQWINSAWWQWGNWQEGSNVDEYIQRIEPANMWLQDYNNWSSLSWVGNINVLSLNSSLMAEFCAILGLKDFDHKSHKHNSASSSELLSFMTHNRELRVSESLPMHEFALNKHLKPRSASKWVLSSENIAAILEQNKQSSQEIAKLISNENILENSAWWDGAFYQTKADACDRSTELSREELSDMLLEAYLVISQLDEKIRLESTEYKVTPEEVNSLSKIAVSVEDHDLKSSLFLMGLANKLRPTGPFIKNKLEEYKAKIFK